MPEEGEEEERALSAEEEVEGGKTESQSLLCHHEKQQPQKKKQAEALAPLVPGGQDYNRPRDRFPEEPLYDVHLQEFLTRRHSKKSPLAKLLPRGDLHSLHSTGSKTP